MGQYSKFDRVMEARDHFKNGAKSKSQMSRRFFLRVWTKGVVFVSIIGLVSCQMKQKQTPYLSTTLSPYSEELNFVPSFIFQLETYAELETGLEDTQIYTGIGSRDGTSGYWVKIGPSFTTISLKKDEAFNICRDTIRYKFSGDTTIIALELIHHLSTNEIQYIWLDENNNRSEKAIIISIDYPLKKGKKFPDLTVELLNGEQLSFSDFIGKTVVVNWWFVGCVPCMAEIPGLNKLIEQYKENSNVVFIAIAHSRRDDVNHFLESSEFNYIHSLANADAVRLLGGTYPVNLIINSEGIIYYSTKGGGTDAHLKIDSALKKLLE